ncbi:MAG TPA: glycosyltransferase [Bryobacteraceae bacterium]|nr:glycosyltransferase [Bryobacteraceae bacterium]
MQSKPTVHLIYFEAGGGHRSAAIALESVVASKNYGWNVKLVNLQEVLDSLDVFRKITGVRMEDVYNLILAKGWTLGSAALLPVMHGILRIYHSAQVELLTAFWRSQPPDMVVSLVPNFNRAMFEALRRGAPDAPFISILTDLADYPPHFWMESQPQYFVCGTHKAVEQALNMGHPTQRVFQVSGMILRPQFYEPQKPDRSAERLRLGLDPTLPTGLVLFGGEGSNVMFPIANRLGNAPVDLQLIMICGRNQRLRQRLQSIKTRNKLFIEGFTKEIPYYMHLSDFFIGKPGPGSISESLKMNLPVIVERNSWTLPQERYNAEWVKEQGVGIVLDNFRKIEPTVANLLSDRRLDLMRHNIACVDNRAVFEIPPILAKILAEHPL